MTSANYFGEILEWFGYMVATRAMNLNFPFLVSGFGVVGDSHSGVYTGELLQKELENTEI